MTADMHGSWKPIRDLYETMLKKQPLTEDDVLVNPTPIALFAIQDTIRSDAYNIVRWF